MKQRWLSAGILFCMVAGLLSACGKADTAEADFFLRFGGENITLDEYRLYARDGIALVSGRFANEHGANPNDADFWTTAFDGEKPIDAVKEYGEERLREDKGIQLLAAEYGLADYLSYDALLEALAAENEARVAQYEAGEVFYGPVAFSVEEYASYRQSDYYYALLDYVNTEVVVPTEEQLQEHYELLLAEEGHMNYTAETAYFYWQTGEMDSEVVAALETALLGGAQPAVAAGQVAELYGTAVGSAELAVATRDMGKEDTVYQQMVDLLWDVETGQSTELAFGDGTTSVVFVLQKEWEPFGAYEENTMYVEDSFREKAAKDLIRRRTNAYELEYGSLYEQLTYADLVG